MNEHLRYAAQCVFLAETAPTAEERAGWADLARRWLRCALEIAEAEAEAGSKAEDSHPEARTAG